MNLTFDDRLINRESVEDVSANDDSVDVDTDSNGTSSIKSFSEFSLQFLNNIVRGFKNADFKSLT